MDLSVLIDRKLVPLLPAEAQDQRVSNLIQSLLVAACLGTLSALQAWQSTPHRKAGSSDSGS